MLLGASMTIVTEIDYSCFQGCKVDLVSENCQTVNPPLLLILHYLLAG